MSQVSEAERISNEKGTIAYRSNQAQLKEPLRKVILTVPLLQIMQESRKQKGKMVTRGFYLNVPKSTVQSMDLKEHDQIEVVLKKAH